LNSKLKNEYQGALAAGKTVFSQYYPIETRDLIQLYAGAKEIADERFYWQSSDQNTAFLGIGIVKRYENPSLSCFDEERQKLKIQHFQPSDEWMKATLLGAFPFDEHYSDVTTWGKLGTGLFVLPQILFRKRKNEYGVVLSVEIAVGETYDSLVQKFRQLKQQVDQFISCFSQGQSKNMVPTLLQQKELAVPQWLNAVDETVSAIRAQESPLEKVVLARQMKIITEEEIDTSDVLARLAQQQSNTYLFSFEDDYSFIGATPERLLQATPTHFETVSIAGSAPRGKTPEEDQQIAASLLTDPKNTHEHQVVVNRLEQALSSLLAEGFHSEKRSIIQNRDIQHLFVPLSGKRKPAVSFLEAVAKLHPTPALGGEPKTDALAWIRDHEPASRGLYGGPIGWLGIQEDVGEFAVAIRSGVLHKSEGVLYAGCGIVADSVAEEERQETALKFQPMLRGLLGDVKEK
jgi:menaquinone-specific isochorismate synthase